MLVIAQVMQNLKRKNTEKDSNVDVVIKHLNIICLVSRGEMGGATLPQSKTKLFSRQFVFKYSMTTSPLLSSSDNYKGLQRDIVYLGWSIEPSYLSPNEGGGESLGLSQRVRLYTGAQINFGDLTPYLTYGSQGSIS